MGARHALIAPDGHVSSVLPGILERRKRRDALIRSKSITACGETIRSTPPVEISTKENKYEKNNPN